MDRKLLPIGTVVILKESEGRVMISGYLPITDSDSKHAWDYSGFRFPEGYIDDKGVFCFEHDQIEDIVQYGFLDYEGVEFITKIETIMDEVKKKVAEGE